MAAKRSKTHSPVGGRRLALGAFLGVAVCCLRCAAGHGIGSNDGHGESAEGAGGALAGQLNPPAPAPTLTAATVGLGFLLVGLAALFSTLGSALPFLDGLIQSERFYGGRFRDFSIARSKPFISATLGFSAGLLVTLSLSDLMPGGAENLKKAAIFPSKHAQLVSSVFFAVGFTAVAACKRLSARLRGSKPDGGDETAHTSHHGHKGDFGERQWSPEGEESDRLNTLGYQIAISLALHNFPEGLSTFSAALLSPRIGILYGIALSLHKIPEGLMMCLPIYYSSGSRVQAFAVAALFGAMSQFAGALAAFLLFRLIRPAAIVAFTGFVFSAVAGLLLYIVVGGILPLSRASDPEDRFVTKSVLAGAAFFYFVLSIFSYV